MPSLFDKIKLGNLQLNNRLVMAPLTRCRAIANRIPNQLMQEYYTQRASFGLIITEATSVDKMGVGYPDTPGIWNEEQVEGWQKITQAVHQKGGKIFLQLWHVGRISDPSYLNGQLPLAPSAIAATGHLSQLRPIRDFVTPRALAKDEIKEIMEQFIKGAKNAKDAGFDGVEIHGANGYLLDQFMQDCSNKRTDNYGGSIENRLRFPLEVVDGILTIWPGNLVGYHISPRCDAHSMGDSNPLTIFSALITELNKRNIGFICSREKVANDSIGHKLRTIFNGLYIANEGFDKVSAQQMIEDKSADMVAFGKLALANPDLVERFLNDAKLNKPDSSTFYASGQQGYTDYPFLN